MRLLTTVVLVLSLLAFACASDSDQAGEQSSEPFPAESFIVGCGDQLVADGSPASAEMDATGLSCQFSLPLAAGDLIQVDVASEAFDPAVQMFGPADRSLGFDEDGGAGGSARLVTAAWEGGNFGVEVWTEDLRTGEFTISVTLTATGDTSFWGGDEDGDGLTDGDETFIYGTYSDAVDTDGDGLSDYDELREFLTDPSHVDTDRDGVDDGIELERGTSPTSP